MFLTVNKHRAAKKQMNGRIYYSDGKTMKIISYNKYDIFFGTFTDIVYMKR